MESILDGRPRKIYREVSVSESRGTREVIKLGLHKSFGNSTKNRWKGLNSYMKKDYITERSNILLYVYTSYIRNCIQYRAWKADLIK